MVVAWCSLEISVCHGWFEVAGNNDEKLTIERWFCTEDEFSMKMYVVSQLKIKIILFYSQG